MSHIRQRRWSGYQSISSSDGHWTITCALQGSFDCPTLLMSFDLEHRAKPEKLDYGRVQHPAIQSAKEGRWHVYHLTIDGREAEVRALEERQKRRGGVSYERRLTMLLHESIFLNKVLGDKILSWFLSSTEHQKWFGSQREDKQHHAFFVNKGDWTPIKQVYPNAHEMIFIGHPMQDAQDISKAYQLREEMIKDGMPDGEPVMACPCTKGKWCCAEKVFDHGCVLPKVGNVFAIKDNYGFVLVVGGK